MKNKTNCIKIIDHGTMLSDYYSGTPGIMLSILVDNGTTYQDIIDMIDNEIADLWDHIQYTSEYHNYNGNIEKDIEREVQKIKDENKDKLGTIAFPDLEFNFNDINEDEFDCNEYPVLILSIEFNFDEFLPDYRCSIVNARKNGLSLQYAFEYPEKFYGMPDYIENIIEQNIEGSLENIWQDFSCFDYYNIPVLEQAKNGDEFSPGLLEDETDIKIEHCLGYYLPWKTGDKNENNGLVFVGTLPGIGEEIEDQADNGRLAYYYIGSNYFEVWVHERFVDWEKIETR